MEEHTEKCLDEHDEQNEKKKSVTAKFSWKSDDPAGQCGCGPCLSPRWLQWFRWPPVILAYFWIVGVVIYMGSSYFGAVLPAVERRFGLSSSQSAFLMVIEDLAATLVCVFTSFYAERSSRPVVMGLSLMLMAFGKLLTAFPHILSEPLDTEALLSGQLSSGSQQLSNSTNRPQHLCISDIDEHSKENMIANNACNEEAVGFGGLLWWALIGQIVYGFGQASFIPIIIPYLDDLAGRVRRRYVIYYTVFASVWTGGPAVGYFLGGICLEYYVDFNRIPKDKIPVGISKWDPRWIGAWWMGFVASFVALFILSIPAFMLPKDPSVNVCVKKNRESLEEPLQEVGGALVEFEPERRADSQKGFRENAKAFLPVMKKILTRPVLVFQMFYMTIELACISVFAAFVVKYFMLQFGISGTQAAFLNGVILIPASLLGLCTSAFICHHFKLTLKQCAWYLVINNIITVLLIIIATFIGCQNLPVAGVNVQYQQSDITGVCNSLCGCKDNVFRPVCDPSGVSYISPCHAGCQTKDVYMNSSRFSTYSDCSCLEKLQNSSDVQYKGDEFGSVKSGLCKRESKCGIKVYIVALMFGAMAFCRFQDNAPLSLIVLGNSETEIRTTVYGVTKVVHHILGFFPTPIYFGAIINSACRLWRYSCGNRGSCWLYDIVKLRYSFFGVNFALRVLQIPICIAILWTVKETLSKPNEYHQINNVNNEDGSACVDDKGKAGGNVNGSEKKSEMDSI